jgi:hypothetical protein
MPTVYSPPLSTYVPLATYTVTGSPDASVTFSSIPATYRDLIVVFQGRATPSNGAGGVRFNSDSGNNYSTVEVAGNATPPFTSSSSGNNAAYFTFSFAVESVGTTTSNIQVLDYSASDKHKPMLTRTSIGQDLVPAMYAHRWANTDPITSVEVFLLTNSFVVGSTFSLYGIAS